MNNRRKKIHSVEECDKREKELEEKIDLLTRKVKAHNDKWAALSEINAAGGLSAASLVIGGIDIEPEWFAANQDLSVGKIAGLIRGRLGK